MKNLKNLRKKHNLNQEQFGHIIGYGQHAVSHWEKGQREPSIETIIKIADYFNVTTDYLLGHKNNEPEFFTNEKTLIPDYQQEVIDLVLKLNSRQCSRLCGYIERQFEETTYKTKDLK